MGEVMPGPELDGRHGHLGRLTPRLSTTRVSDISMAKGTSGEYVIIGSTLHYLLQGSVAMRVAGAESIVRAGTILVFPPGPRQFDIGEATRMLTLKLPELAFAGRFAVEAAFLPLATRRLRAEWAERMHSLRDDFSEGARAEVVLAVAPIWQNDAYERARRHTNLIESVLSYLAQRLDSSPTLEEVGDRFGFAPNHINDVVSRSTGKSIRQWSLTYRLDAAQRAVIRSSASLGAVASAYGFEPTYFPRRFGERYGMSPSAWRASYRASLSQGDARPTFGLSSQWLALSPS
jgi:AraC-like DNA-binding protein